MNTGRIGQSVFDLLVGLDQGSSWQERRHWHSGCETRSGSDHWHPFRIFPLTVRALLICSLTQTIREVTIDVPENSRHHGYSILALVDWMEPMSYRYRDHCLWVNNAAKAGPAFILTEGGTTLGPFHGQAWIVAQSPQGGVADATLVVEEVSLTWPTIV